MVNAVMLVGRLVRDPEVVEHENGKSVSKITLAVNRSFKGSDGNYSTDFIDCVLWNNKARHLQEYCLKGDIIGIRGRIQVDFYEKDGNKKKITDVIAESVTFISRNKNRSNEMYDINVKEDE